MSNPTPTPQAVGAAAVPATPQWSPMSDAPRDGTPILLCPKLSNDACNLKCPFVGRDWGDGAGWSFAAPVGYGGIPDDWLRGWRSLSASPSPASTSAPPTDSTQCFYCSRDMIAGSECASKAQSESCAVMKGSGPGAPDAANAGEPVAYLLRRRVPGSEWGAWAICTAADHAAVTANRMHWGMECESIAVFATPTGVAADESTRAPDGREALSEEQVYALGERWHDEESMASVALDDPTQCEHRALEVNAFCAGYRAALASGERPSAPANNEEN